MSRSKAWCFTINNPDADWSANLPPEREGERFDAVSYPRPEAVCAVRLNEAVASGEATYITWQLEMGASGTYHYQGYVEFAERKRMAGVKKVIGEAHCEPRKGTQLQAVNYCQKRDTRLGGPWTHGQLSEVTQGKRSDLEAACEVAANEGIKAVMQQHPTSYVKYYKGLTKVADEARQDKLLTREKETFSTAVLRPWQQTLVDKLSGTPDPRKIHWYWEDEGNVGKTFVAKYLMSMHDALVLDCSKKADLSYMIKDHQGAVILFNITRTIGDDFMNHVYGLCESIKDDLVISTKYETKRVPLGPQHVVVFSNREPEYDKWSQDRYDVHKIDTTSPWNPKKPSLKRKATDQDFQGAERMKIYAPGFSPGDQSK